MHFNVNVYVFIIILLHHCTCDYRCLCSYNVDTPVYKNADNSEVPIGALYEYDCNTLISDGDPLWATIAYHHKVAFVEKNSQTRVQMCRGDVPELDKLLMTATPDMSTIPTTTIQATAVVTSPRQRTTMSTTTTQVPTKSTSTTMSLTITPPMLSTTIRPTTTTHLTPEAISRTASTSIDGNLGLCHTYIKNDANKNHGFLGQHGQYCYELVDTPTTWAVAEGHCKLLLSGTLVHVLNQNVQDYLVKFLTGHTYIKSVWIGLTDSNIPTVVALNATEGNWKWSSGAPYTYNNFGNEFTSHTDQQHNLNDCAVMHQGGEWSDLPCGLSLGIVGFGESHPYICQYSRLRREECSN